MQRPYLVDETRMDLKRRKTPSTFIGVELCAAYVGAQAVKILLRRGEVKPAPFHYHFDAYRNMFQARMQTGNGGLLQRLRCYVVERILKKRAGANSAERLQVCRRQLNASSTRRIGRPAATMRSHGRSRSRAKTTSPS